MCAAWGGAGGAHPSAWGAHHSVWGCAPLSLGVRTRVVRGDINFKIQRDPLDFLFLIDPYGPYLIEFSFENGSFLLTKALFWVNFCPFRATGRKGRG